MVINSIFQAEIIDPIIEKQKDRSESKQKELEFYEKNKSVLQELEVNRLRNNAKHVVRISEFDCGPCARCRVHNCNGNDCKKKKQGRL